MEQNNKRILKNTVYLYVRQFVVMALAFFSTRIVLDKLGVDDYGLYNVVGGFVSLFTILNSVLQSSTRRFMSLAIGKADAETTRRTFQTSLVLHVGIALVMALALMTAGFWFLNEKLNIAPDRLDAAKWVFLFSTMNVMMLIVQTPYIATVTAHEHFNIYAVLSVFDVLAKIAILFLLVWLPFDKLIVYAALISAVSFSGSCIYFVYCGKHFPECRKARLRIDKPLFREMLTFSGWDSVGNASVIINTQGITILLNLFFSVAVNSARGLANSVIVAVEQFVGGFVQAAEPQLIKFYAQNDKPHFERLVFNISQMSLFMLAILAVPIWLEVDFVLQLWLTNVPDYTAEFIKITVVTSFIAYSNVMLIRGCNAIGRVKQLNAFLSPLALLHLPLVYVVLRLGWNPTAVYWVGTVPSILRMFIALYILRRYFDFPAHTYFFRIFLKNVLLVAVSCVIPYFIRQTMDDNWLRFVVVCGTSVTCTLAMMWLFALNKDVKRAVLQKIHLA